MAWKKMRAGAGQNNGGLGQRDRWLLLLDEPFVDEAPSPRWFLVTTLYDAFCARDHVHGLERRQDASYDAQSVFSIALDRIRCTRNAKIETHEGVRIVDLCIPFDDPRWVEILGWLNAERNVDHSEL